MIGKDQTLKVILSSYIAILASDAVSSIVSRVVFGSAVSGVLVIPSEQKALILIKIALFVFLTVALTTRGAFEILVADERSPFIRMMMTFAYGILSAGLIISTILVYISGASLIGTATASGNPIEDIASTSRLVQLMIQNYAVWFSLPALAFVVASLFGSES